MLKLKYLTTNREEVTIDDAAGNVTFIVIDAMAVVVFDAVKLQSMLENLF
jgi:hypothetical protein